jgi:putative glycosyltransferase (TIGR04372 family)
MSLGRMRDAIEIFQQAIRIRRAHKAFSDADKYDRYCLLDGFWAMHIGHAAQIDYVVKLRMLHGCDPKDTFLYVPHLNELPNRFLVEQWGPHLRLVTDCSDLPFPKKYTKALALDFYVPSVSGIGRYYLWELAAQTYQRWAKEGREPVLKLAEEVQGRGRRALASAGVPPGAWFVGLHVREPQYTRHHRGLLGVLNAEIEDYLPAIDEIVRRGGWVIRMGDPSMTPLPPLPNVLDYCHSAIRSDWMDVFLCAMCRFFIGTSSGVCYVAQDYGVPCVLTNWWPPAQRPWHSGDIFVPKILRRMRSGEILSLAESLDEPFGYCHSVDYLQEKHGVTVQDNRPEDICAAVVEMFEHMDGRPNYDQSDLAMRRRAEAIYASVAMRLYDSPGAFGAAALARDFLRRNPSFLEM